MSKSSCARLDSRGRLSPHKHFVRLLENPFKPTTMQAARDPSTPTRAPLRVARVSAQDDSLPRVALLDSVRPGYSSDLCLRWSSAFLISPKAATNPKSTLSLTP